VESEADVQQDRPMTGSPTDGAGHWDDRYRTVGSTSVSWFQDRPSLSLRLLAEAGVGPGSRVVDVGGGASRLVDELASSGVQVTVVDLSAAALAEARGRVLDASVSWVVADVRTWEPDGEVDAWHDRAAYHFLTDEADRARYWDVARTHVRQGGHVVIATFAEDGPEMCSGLPVVRYSPDELAAAMGPGFEAVRSERETHVTPSGGEQRFTWVLARRA
jgi:cyclopropane fatty-acyl-phospholipid synthase-like methyltransferase